MDVNEIAARPGSIFTHTHTHGHAPQAAERRACRAARNDGRTVNYTALNIEFTAQNDRMS